MRITEIEIKSFKGLYGSYKIDLHKAGKNLLIYGENGSGKSSFYQALKLFLESEAKNHQFAEHQNIFIDVNDCGYIRLHLRADPHSKQWTYEWSNSARETDDVLIVDASKAKGFLDYKGLLDTHYIQRNDEAVNLFDLLVGDLLANAVNSVTNRSFSEDWNSVNSAIPLRNTQRQVAALEERVHDFNTGLFDKLAELRDMASEILRKFGYNIALSFGFHGITYERHHKRLDNQQITLSVRFFDRDLISHHHFLNEAKLSAIAVAISFASFLLQPASDLRILALDDVLIGLDMSNRLPVIDIIEEYFSDCQIFFMTFDRTWYEIVKQRTAESKWKYVEFFFSQTDEHEIPIYHEDRKYLKKAKEYFAANDFKACVVYLRTAFELAIKKFCERKNLQVKYRDNPKHLTSEDFWTPIKSAIDNQGVAILEPKIVQEIELYRSIILNPLSHATIVTTIKKEITLAIKAVENLEVKLSQ